VQTAAIEPVCGLLGEGASFLLPMLFFTYFFIRGFVVTVTTHQSLAECITVDGRWISRECGGLQVMYVWVKGQTTKKQAALLTIQMGWCDFLVARVAA
jgi:superfamily II DNA/RNA helicase